jgi:MarR family transcriptional regulator for hemolysin
VKRLEEKGLVILVPDPDDRRIRRVSVSPAGTKARNQAVKALDATKSELAILSQKEWTQLLPLLNRLRVALDSAR